MCILDGICAAAGYVYHERTAGCGRRSRRHAHRHTCRYRASSLVTNLDDKLHRIQQQQQLELLRRYVD